MNKILLYFWALCLTSCCFARVPPGYIEVSAKLRISQKLYSFQRQPVAIDNTYTVQELSKVIEENLWQGLIYAEDGFLHPELIQEGIGCFSEFWADSAAPDKMETWKNYNFTYSNNPRKKITVTDQKNVVVALFEGFSYALDKQES